VSSFVVVAVRSRKSPPPFASARAIADVVATAATVITRAIQRSERVIVLYDSF